MQTASGVLYQNGVNSRVSTAPKVVSVVLNWNGWLDTIECLESLLRSDYADHQIVICDNGSQDHSIERLTEWADGLLRVKNDMVESNGRTWSYEPAPKPIRYVLYDSPKQAFDVPAINDVPLIFIRVGKNLGYAGGNNVGIRYAIEALHAQYVWILNNDTVVDRHAITHFARAFELRPDAAVLGSRLMRYDAPETIQALGGGTLDPRLARDTQHGRGRRSHEKLNEPLDLEHVIGASMFIRRDAIEDVGLLDESYFLYREETDWCLEMRKNGWNLMYCPESVVWHKEGHSVGFKSSLHDYYAVRNMLYLVQKHYPEHLASAFIISFWRAAAPKFARLQLRRLGYVVKAYWDFLRGVRGMTAINPDLYFLQERLI
jgi:GT2 family glycosyltransferase